MSRRPVVADYACTPLALTQARHAVAHRVCIVETATGVMVVISVDMVVVVMPEPRIIARVPARVIAPIIRRVPANPRRSPEPVINDRAIDIYRFNDIVGAIDILVTYDLHGHCPVSLPLHVDGGDILINILCKHSLQDDKAVLPLAYFDHAQIVHHAVAVEVEVVEMALLGIEFFFKLLKIVHFAEQRSHSLEVEVFGYVGVG